MRIRTSGPVEPCGPEFVEPTYSHGAGNPVPLEHAQASLVDKHMVVRVLGKFHTGCVHRVHSSCRACGGKGKGYKLQIPLTLGNPPWMCIQTQS